MAKAVGEKREAWNMIEGFRNRGEQLPTGSLQGGGQSTEEYGGRTVPKACRIWWQIDDIQDGTGVELRMEGT